MKKKILIIGASGMLGHIVYHYLSLNSDYTLYNSVHKNKLNEHSRICNVKNNNQLIDLLNTINPDVVINCIGALVKESKEDSAGTIYLNSYLPHILRFQCDLRGAKLIQISTDCVFSGKSGNYSENDFKDADDIYGRSKALGEIYNSPHATLRTSIIGPELKENGTGLLHWFMLQNGEIKGYSKAYWGGVTTLELAKSIKKVIDNDLKGLFHVSNGIAISKYNLLCIINEFFTEKKITIVEFDNYISNKSLKPSMKFDFEIPSYYKMLEELTNYIKINKSIYKYDF